MVLDAIKANRLHIHTDRVMSSRIEARTKALLEAMPPNGQWHSVRSERRTRATFAAIRQARQCRGSPVRSCGENPQYACPSIHALRHRCGPATLGEAWAEDGIRVNGIAPGFVDTNLTKGTTANARRRKGVEQRVPLKRLGTPADIAGAALFLASPLASYIIGQTLVVDGGLTLA